MKQIAGLENHEILREALTDYDEMLGRKETLRELQLKDMNMRLRYALEYITQQYARKHQFIWTTPNELIKQLKQNEIITSKEAEILHTVRLVSNSEGAHLSEKLTPLEKSIYAYNKLLDFTVKFLQDIPVPCQEELITSNTNVTQSTNRKKAKDFCVNDFSKITPLKMEFTDYAQRLSVKYYLEKARRDRNYYIEWMLNKNLTEWLVFDGKGPATNPYMYSEVNNGKTEWFVDRMKLVRDYNQKVKMLTSYKPEFATPGLAEEEGKCIYIPGLIQGYFGYSEVVFDADSWEWVTLPVEPAVIIRDYSLFSSTAELPDCIWNVEVDDSFNLAYDFTFEDCLNHYERIRHLVLPDSYYGTLHFLRWLPYLESITFKNKPKHLIEEDGVYYRVRESETGEKHKELWFVGDISRTQVTIATDIDTINDYAFFKSCVEEVVIPEGVKSLIGCIFYRCKYLKKLVLPNTIEELSYEAIRECGLKELVLPSSLKVIEEYGIWGLAVTKLVIPASVKKLGNYAIYACHELTEIVFEGDIHEIDIHPDAIVWCPKLTNNPCSKHAPVKSPAAAQVAKQPVQAQASQLQQKKTTSRPLPEGFRSFETEQEKLALIQELKSDLEFVEYIRTADVKPNLRRNGYEIVHDWEMQGTQRFQADMRAVYEAGCQLRGIDPTPIEDSAYQSAPKARTAPPASKAPAQPKNRAVERKSTAPASTAGQKLKKKATRKMISFLEKLLDDE